MNDLFNDILDDVINTKTSDGLESKIIVPQKCYNCNTSAVCNVLETFIEIATIGIVVQLVECPYAQSI